MTLMRITRTASMADDYTENMVLVPSIGQGPDAVFGYCSGCVFNSRSLGDNGCPNTVVLRGSMERVDLRCIGLKIWIKDTPQGRADYVRLKLENS